MRKSWHLILDKCLERSKHLFLLSKTKIVDINLTNYTMAVSFSLSFFTSIFESLQTVSILEFVLPKVLNFGS